MSDKIYYIQENGAVSQAYSIEELRIKNLSPTSLVCVKYDTWKEAKDIPEVAKIIYWTQNMPIEQNWSLIQQSQVQNNKIIVSPKEVIDPTVKIWTIILSSLLIVGFFLPWIKVFVSVSAWDVIFGDVSKAVDIGSKYFLVLLPLLGIYNIIVVSVPNDSDPTFNKIVRTLPIIILGLFIFIGLGSINDKLDLEGPA